MRKSDIEINGILTPASFYQWPDKSLNQAFREVFTVYKGLIEKYFSKVNNNPEQAINKAFKRICNWIILSSYPQKKRKCIKSKVFKEEQQVFHSVVERLKGKYNNNWLQTVASLLGMLMHFSFNDEYDNVLCNPRRPGKLFSTYPNSPQVTKIIADNIITELLKDQSPILKTCSSYLEAEQYVEKNINFRILDPSMESGHLLLEVAIALIRKIKEKHQVQSSAFKYLTTATLKKLTRNCLWGIDRNPLSKFAVSTVFKLLGNEYAIEGIKLNHLIVADTLEYYEAGKIHSFDGIINNPPWGEQLTPGQRKTLKKTFKTLTIQADTYIAFSEMILKCLRPGGLFALILPSQIISTSNSGKLRKLISSSASVDQMILLPRAAFANATVRGILMMGKTKPHIIGDKCNVLIYPMEKSFSEAETGLITQRKISLEVLKKVGEQSWWDMFHQNRSRSYKAEPETVSLQAVADVIMGVKLYGKGRGTPPQTAETVAKKPFTYNHPAPGTVPVLHGRDVRKFYVRKPNKFVKFGKWLAYTGNHLSLLGSERILIRELCHRKGNLTASIVNNGCIPVSGVITIVPKLIDIDMLTAFLNSSKAAEYVRLHTASFSKIDFQKITLSELRQMPVPFSLIESKFRSHFSLKPQSEDDRSLCLQLKSLSGKLSNNTDLKQSEAQYWLSGIDDIISILYNR